MKRILPLIMILALLLCACAQVPVEYTVTVDGVDLTVNTEKSTVSDGTYTYTYVRIGIGSGNQKNYTTTIRYPNGAAYEVEQVYMGGSSNPYHVTTSDNYDDTRYQPGEILVEAVQLAQEQKAAQEAKKIDIDWRYLIFGALSLILGVLHLLFPEVMWELGVMFKRWQYRDADPTEAGLEMQKFGAVFCVILGVICIGIAFV